MLILLPFILLPTALIVLAVYGDRIGEKHAGEYRRAVMVCVAVSLAALCVSVVPSLR